MVLLWMAVEIPPVAVHLVVDVPVVQLQQVHRSLTCPSVCNDKCRVDSECRMLWEFRSCRSSKFFNIPVVAQRLFPMVSETMEVPQLLVDKVVDVPVMLVVRLPHVPSWRRQSGFLQLHLLRNSLRSQTSESLGTAWSSSLSR